MVAFHHDSSGQSPYIYMHTYINVMQFPSQIHHLSIVHLIPNGLFMLNASESLWSHVASINLHVQPLLMRIQPTHDQCIHSKLAFKRTNSHICILLAIYICVMTLELKLHLPVNPLVYNILI